MSGNTRQPAEGFAEHARDCPECAATPLPLDRIAMELKDAPIDVDPAALSRRVLLRLEPEIHRRAAMAFRRRVAVGLVLSLIPLAVVLAYDVAVLQFVYQLAKDVLPAAVAAYVVLTYSAFLLLLFALTYAAVPVVLMHRPQRQIGSFT